MKRSERKRLEKIKKKQEAIQKVGKYGKSVLIGTAVMTSVVGCAKQVSDNVGLNDSKTEIVEHGNTKSEVKVKDVVTKKENITKSEANVKDVVAEKENVTKSEVKVEDVVTKKEETAKTETKVENVVAEKEETTKTETKVEDVVTEKEETTKTETKVEDVVAEKEETTKTETKVEDVVTEKEETTNDNSHSQCSNKEKHDEYTCMDGAEALEGGSVLTRDVIATDIFGNEALRLKKGQTVSIGQSRGYGKVSIIGKNIHGKEIELVIREDATKAGQVEHTPDCEVCIPEYAFGRFANAFAMAKSDMYIYPDACNDDGAMEVKADQRFYVVDGAETVNGRIPVQFYNESTDGTTPDEEGTEFYWAEVDSLECDKRATEVYYLMDQDSMKLAATKPIVAKGFLHGSKKNVEIPAFTTMQVWLNSNDGETIAIKYNGMKLLISIEDAKNAGFFI